MTNPICTSCGGPVLEGYEGTHPTIHRSCQVSLPEFLEQMREVLDDFEVDWEQRSKHTPTEYPYYFQSDGEGRWMGELLLFMEDTDIGNT